MNLAELLNVFALAFGLLFAILTFNLLLKRTVKGQSRDLLFKFGVFLLFSSLVLLLPFMRSHIINEAYIFIVEATIKCLWWFSLNMLANELLTYFIWDKLLPKKGVTVSKLLRDLVALMLIIITIACIFHFVFDKSVVGLFTASGVMAVILGYSAQTTLGEAFAGIGLNITKQFDQGDWINVSGNIGTVVDVNWRFVTLLTKDGNYLSIPNSVIAKANIINQSRPEPIQGISIKIPVSNTYSPESIKQMLTTAASQSLGVMSTHAPVVALTEIANSSGNPNLAVNIYNLTYYTKENPMVITDRVLSNFWYQCKKLDYITEQNQQLLIAQHPQEEIQSFLQQMDLFSSLTEQELADLAIDCKQHFFGPPELLLAQGQSNQSLFLIYTGGVDIYIQTPDGEMTKVAALNSGHYVGEMSLLTGDPAGASIVINTESTIIEITHDSMARLFDQRPELVDKISAVVVSRKLQNENLRASFKQNKDEKHSLISQLANRIKNFFKKPHHIQEEQS